MKIAIYDSTQAQQEQAAADDYRLSSLCAQGRHPLASLAGKVPVVENGVLCVSEMGPGLCLRRHR